MLTPPATSIATQTRASNRIYLLPCLCNNMNEWANVKADKIVQLLIKNLKIDKSNTTLALSMRISRSDPRASSATIG